MQSVIEWRAKHCISMRHLGTLAPGANINLREGYWQGFMKRNRHRVKAQKGVKFDSKMADWCTYLNFQAMYNDVYNKMYLNGIARKLDNTVKLNKDREIVEHAHEAFGLETKYDLIRPDRRTFVDKVGSNTSQLKDGNVGGELFLCSIDGRPQLRSGSKDSHFTVLGFTAANGQPFMCTIIFAANKMTKE